jgi:hypothetical protein
MAFVLFSLLGDSEAYFLGVSVCQFCWSYLEDQYSVLLQGKIHWHSALFGDCSVVHTAFSGIWHCLWIPAYLFFGKSGVSLFLIMRSALYPPFVLCGGMRFAISFWLRVLC